MTSHQLETTERYYQCLLDALIALAKGNEQDRAVLIMSMESIAQNCNIDWDCFNSHFPTIDDLLQNIIHRMKLLFEREVENFLVTCTYTKEKRVLYFLRRVRVYCTKFPEVQYLFNESLFNEKLENNTFSALENYYLYWQVKLEDCLKHVMDDDRAKKISLGYLKLLKGDYRFRESVKASSLCDSTEKLIYTLISY